MKKISLLLSIMTLTSACSLLNSRPKQKTIVTHVKGVPSRQNMQGASVQGLTPLKNGQTDFFMAILKIPTGGRVPLHRDPVAEGVLILAGNGEITIDGQTHKVSSGSFIYMPAGAEVEFKAYSQVKIVQVFAKRGPESKYLNWALPIRP